MEFVIIAAATATAGAAADVVVYFVQTRKPGNRELYTYNICKMCAIGLSPHIFRVKQL